MVFCRSSLEYCHTLLVCRHISAGSIGAEADRYIGDGILFIILGVDGIGTFFRIVIITGVTLEQVSEILDRAHGSAVNG